MKCRVSEQRHEIWDFSKGVEDSSETFHIFFFLCLYVTLEIQFVSAIKDSVASGNCRENKVKKKGFLVQLH